MQKIYQKVYILFMSILALISISMVILDYMKILSITTSPYEYIDNGILIIFAIDYSVRLAKAKNKIHFIGKFYN